MLFGRKKFMRKVNELVRDLLERVHKEPPQLVEAYMNSMAYAVALKEMAARAGMSGSVRLSLRLQANAAPGGTVGCSTFG